MNDSAYTLYIEPERKKKGGYFKKGNIPWNKGLSWNEQGWTKERREKVIAQLRINKDKNKYNRMNPRTKPVIQMDEDGDRLHWYKSSADAARKLGVNARNIRMVCDGHRKHCGGFRWRWDERFLT
jgi:cell fate regulator YaaT (PSP1 superfamily)